MDSFTSTSIDFVPSTPELSDEMSNVEGGDLSDYDAPEASLFTADISSIDGTINYGKSAAFSQYRTPKASMEDVNSSSPEGTPITSRRNSNSLVAVVEESDLDDTPVATSAKTARPPLVSDGDEDENEDAPRDAVSDEDEGAPHDSESDGDSPPRFVKKISSRNPFDSSLDVTEEPQNDRSDRKSPQKSDQLDSSASPVLNSPFRQPSEEDDEEASPLVIRSKKPTQKVIVTPSDSEDDSTDPPHVPSQSKETHHVEANNHRKEVAVQNEDDIQEVAVVPKQAANVSTISINSTSSEFSEDEAASLKAPKEREKEADLSIQEIPSPPARSVTPPRPSAASLASIAPVWRDTARYLSELRRSLDNKRSLLKTINMKSLPDGGQKIRDQIRDMEQALELAQRKFEASGAAKTAQPQPQPTVVNLAPPFQQARNSQKVEELRKKIQMKKWSLGNATGDQRSQIRAEVTAMERQLSELSVSTLKTYGKVPLVTKEPAIKLLPEAEKMSEIRRMYAEQPADRQLYAKGRQTAAQKREAVSVTMDSIQNLHKSLATCPTERDTEPTPDQLVVELLPHQTRALKWLLWRETQSPAGGILADDMGLGKTLTIISLIVRQRQLIESDPADVWLSKELKIKKSTGTLIVCPASVIGQWDNEIQRRTKRSTLSVITYHGADRHRLASKLCKTDVVLTTYQIIVREISRLDVAKGDDMGPIGDFNIDTQAQAIRQSPLLQVAWERIVLDEAHTIRNPKSQVSQAVCRLRAARRWAVTGTPVQNKELDMYALLRFLRVSPFDQLAVWKRWVDCKSAQGTERLNLLIKTLLLRRTKDQKMEDTGAAIVNMPAREVHTHHIKLSTEENEVYQKILDFSRKALEQYIKNQENKNTNDDWTYNQRDQKSEQKADREVPKTMTKQHLLVLLLRLRQACSHPALIKTMLEASESESIGSEARLDESDDMDIISQMASMKINSRNDAPAAGDQPDSAEEKNFFALSNPIFKASTISSKLKNVIDEVQRVIKKKQKAVIVSQWTSMLDVFDVHFKELNIPCHRIAGNVNVKQRTMFVEDFNTNPKGPPVMLLSLAAGGVGLNLIGGNHLFLTDMHWNPQLEAQACDRVYRVGQIHDVHVHRFVTTGTVEERITELQKRKLELANGILTGSQNVAAKGLSLEDLKLLFDPSPMSRNASANFNGFSGKSSF